MQKVLLSKKLSENLTFLVLFICSGNKSSEELKYEIKEGVLTPAHAPSGFVQSTQGFGWQDFVGWVCLTAAVILTPQALHSTHYKHQLTQSTVSKPCSCCHSYTTGTAQHTL